MLGSAITHRVQSRRPVPLLIAEALVRIGGQQSLSPAAAWPLRPFEISAHATRVLVYAPVRGRKGRFIVPAERVK